MTALAYLLTLQPEEAAAAVKAMSPEAQQLLVANICGAVRETASYLVVNADEIWESRDEQ